MWFIFVKILIFLTIKFDIFFFTIRHFTWLLFNFQGCRADQASFYISDIWFRAALHSGDTCLSPSPISGCCFAYRGGLRAPGWLEKLGHIVCPWNVTWHNMTPGLLYVKVNISAWRLDKSEHGSCQCGFLLTAEKEVLQNCAAMSCVYGTLCVCMRVCRASGHKFNPHRVGSLGPVWKDVVRVVLLFFHLQETSADYWCQGFTVSLSCRVSVLHQDCKLTKYVPKKRSEKQIFNTRLFTTKHCFNCYYVILKTWKH